MPAYRTVNLSDAALKSLVGVAIAGGAVLPLAPSLAQAASVRKEFVIEAPPEFVWDALRDFGALHTRLARGFVSNTRIDGDARLVSFVNGLEAREVLVDLDDERMRLVYSAIGGRLTAHSASAQLYPESPGRTRFVWTADFLPNELEPVISSMMDDGVAAMKKTLEEDAAKR
ncbi:MAG: SRPBCC family protein [Pseudomonadota bacterium]|nr:SRPBCC family protein [Pseudomonadota bacterium]